jgi:hypothetical protein
MSSSGNAVAGNGINLKDRYFQADFDQEATFDPSKNQYFNIADLNKAL